MKPFPSQIPAARILEELESRGAPSLDSGKILAGPWRKTLAGLSDEDLLGVGALSDSDAAACVRSGLLLLGDDLDGSHRVSQSIETPDGSFWHGIMHRREGDYGNSKYWFRRVGDHAIFPDLSAAVNEAGGKVAESLGGGGWDPFAVVDLVEACVRGGRSDLEGELVDLQKQEMLILLASCYRRGTGGAKND